jgi:NTE family protein
VALVLGSGGARGYAHIGVINELRDRGYDITGISGSSMGALVGCLQAAGKLDEFTEWAKSLTQGAVLRLLDPSFTAAGMLRAEKILDAVRDIVGDISMEDLLIPCTAVATDLVAGRSVWLQQGPVDDAIRASIAIPGLIAPHPLDGRLLADGGILDALPMAPVAAVNADLKIAVSLGGGDDFGDGHDGSGDGQGAGAEWFDRVTSALLDTNAVRSLLDSSTAQAVFSRFGIATADDSESDDPNDGDDAAGVPKLSSFEVMDRSIDIAQAALTRNHLAMYPPDLLIEVPRSAARSLDFHCAEELIDLGRQLAGRALDSGQDVR